MAKSLCGRRPHWISDNGFRNCHTGRSCRQSLRNSCSNLLKTPGAEPHDSGLRKMRERRRTAWYRSPALRSKDTAAGSLTVCCRFPGGRRQCTESASGSLCGFRRCRLSAQRSDGRDWLQNEAGHFHNHGTLFHQEGPIPLYRRQFPGRCPSPLRPARPEDGTSKKSGGGGKERRS